MKSSLLPIKLDDVRAVFFPRNFHEKYRYLGSVPWEPKRNMLHALTLALDAEARPWWCPRWYLRFLYLFGCDNSIVRVRSQLMHRWFMRLTRGVRIWDYKTKWTDYDLRIYISAPDYLYDLSQAIELYTYKQGENARSSQVG